MSNSPFYPETGSSIIPIYQRVRTRTPSGDIGESYESVFTRDELAATGPDTSTPTGFSDAWFVMLKDTFSWSSMQWDVVQQASTTDGLLEIVAAKVSGSVVDYFARATLIQAPTY
jgi:hypothetical protein